MEITLTKINQLSANSITLHNTNYTYNVYIHDLNFFVELFSDYPQHAAQFRISTIGINKIEILNSNPII